MDSEESYHGQVTAINPVVQVKARIRNDGNLMEGLNVKVLIPKQISGKFVVPKAAVILRQNQEFLFKYQDGKVFWTYVQTTDENSSSY